MMNSKKIVIYSFGSILLAAAASSCALLDQSQTLIMRGNSAKEVTIVDHTTDREVPGEEDATALDGPVLSPPKNGTSTAKDKAVNASAGKAVKNKRQKKTDSGKSSSSVSKKDLEAARREVSAVAASESASDATGSAAGSLKIANDVPAGFSIGGQWSIYSVRNNKVGGEERPYINFDLGVKRFYGSNGCNYINGDLGLEAQGKITLANIISSQRLCQDAPLEHLINLSLSEVRAYHVRQDGNVTYLELSGDNAALPALMVLRRQNMEFLNGAWKITELNGTPMTEEASITIDVEEHRIHGNTGCNIFNGTLFIDPDKTDSMQFTDLASTRMACPDNVRETELLLALEEVETARADDRDTVSMYSVDGSLLFKMKRLTLHQDQSAD